LPVTFRAPLPSWANEVISTMGWNSMSLLWCMACQFCWKFRARPTFIESFDTIYPSEAPLGYPLQGGVFVSDHAVEGL
jgi:hypothetical protein